MESTFENTDKDGEVKSSLTVQTSPKDSDKVQFVVNHRGTVVRFAATTDEIQTIVTDLQGFLNRRGVDNDNGPSAVLVEQAQSAIEALQAFVDTADC